MKKEIKTYSTVCDCCENPLNECASVRNDGSYQNPYVSKGIFDLCHVCAGKIFDYFIVPKLSDEKIADMIKTMRGKTGNLDLVEIDLKEVEVSGVVDMAVGINDHNGIFVPLKNTSSLDQVTSLEEL
jgi:hypothetical protein